MRHETRPTHADLTRYLMPTVAGDTARLVATSGLQLKDSLARLLDILDSSGLFPEATAAFAAARAVRRRAGPSSASRLASPLLRSWLNNFSPAIEGRAGLDLIRRQLLELPNRCLGFSSAEPFELHFAVRGGFVETADPAILLCVNRSGSLTVRSSGGRFTLSPTARSGSWHVIRMVTSR